VRDVLAEYEPLLAATISDALLAGWLYAGQQLAERPELEDELPEEDEGELFPSKQFADDGPPDDDDPPTLQLPDPDEDSPIEFPLLQEAADSLATKRVVTQDEFNEISDRLREQAFSIASVANLDALEKLQTALTDDIRDGGTLEEFADRVEEVLGTSALAPHHIENVYRTNIAAAIGEAEQTILDNEYVNSAFPYVEVVVTHDGRTRKSHKYFETGGIDGTAIYRSDDPVIRKFWPGSWDYQCLPRDAVVRTSTGPKDICKIKTGDLVLTHKGRLRPVLGSHTSKGPSEIVSLHFDDGSVCSLTDNHRVLSENGWVESGRLNVGDEVFKYSNSTTADMVAAKVDDGFKPGVSANEIVSIFARAGIDLLDFQANFQFGKIKVEPKRRDIVIKGILNTNAVKAGGNYGFILGHLGDKIWMLFGLNELVSLLGVRHFLSDIRRATMGMHSVYHGLSDFRSPISHVCSISLSDLLCTIRMSCVMGGIRFPAASHHDAIGGEYPHGGAILDVRPSANFRQTGFSGPVLSESGIYAAGPRIELSDSFFGICRGSIWLFSHTYNCTSTTKKVKAKKRLPWGGQDVFNLSVLDDESFIANDTVVHNCRCGSIMLTREDAAKKGLREAQEWVRTGTPPPYTYVEHPPFEPWERPPPEWR